MGKYGSFVEDEIHSTFPFFYLLFAALLSDTLRTYTKTGCDLEPITLSCPRGTSISIDVAQYMPTSIENECVATTGSTAENIIQDGVVNAGTEIEIKAPEKCSWPNVLSVSIVNLSLLYGLLLPRHTFCAPFLSYWEFEHVKRRAGTIQYWKFHHTSCCETN